MAHLRHSNERQEKREMKELIFTLALRGICQKKASIFNTLTYLSNSDLVSCNYLIIVYYTGNCYMKSIKYL